MGMLLLVWRFIELMGKRNLLWFLKKRLFLFCCINVNIKSCVGNKKIFKIKVIFIVIFKEIMGKGGYGNLYLFLVN